MVDITGTMMARHIAALRHYFCRNCDLGGIVISIPGRETPNGKKDDQTDHRCGDDGKDNTKNGKSTKVALTNGVAVFALGCGEGVFVLPCR
jgi:hypothetical protein